MASIKTSSIKKKARKSKKASVVANETVQEPRKRAKSRRSSERTSARESRTREVTVEEITEQISIFEVVTDSAIAAKPFLLVFASLFCMYIGLSLFSFSPNDMQILSTGDVVNWCGVLGVLLSTKLYGLFGYGAWVTLPIGVLCAWMAAGRTILGPVKMIGVGLLFWNLLCVLSLLHTEPTQLGFYAGGVFGHTTTVLMTKMIGTGGAWLLLSGLAVTIFIFVAGMELKDIVERSLQGIEERGPDLGQRSLNWSQDVLYLLKERSRDIADSVTGSLKDRFSREPVVDEDDWYGDSFMDTGSVFTDDGFGYSEEDSLPPNSFEHSSEYDFHGDEESESFTYDYHTQELPSDVTKTRVQHREVAQVELSESWADKPDDSTFDPNPIPRQPEPVQVRRVQPISDDTVTSNNTGAGSIKRPEIHRHDSLAGVNPFASPSGVSENPISKPSNLEIENRGVHGLPAQEEIDLPENAWEEDLSEWYVTATQGPMSAPKQKLSALPPVPLKSTLNIRRPALSEPEVGSVADHLMAADIEEYTSEAEPDQYDLPKPIAPPAQQNRTPIDQGLGLQYPVDILESAEQSRGHSLSNAGKGTDESIDAQLNSSKPSSVSQLAGQIEDLKSQARQQTAEKEYVKSNIQLPEREVTPAMAMHVDAIDFDEHSEEDFEESTPARAMVNPGNIETGGQGEVRELTNPYVDFRLPTLDMLDYHEKDVAKYDEDELMELADTLVDKLADFKVHGEVETICPGPVITTFEFKPARGVRVSKIATLSDDIAMALRAVSVRIVAPIPGKDVVGIEIPNTERQMIWSRDMLGSKVFQESKAILPMAIGKDVNGFPYVTDLTKTPHLLVAGTTGSGKSVGVNTMLVSMLLRHSPETLRLILVDPKMLEFEMYNNIPHLLHPVVTDPTQASGILQWACVEMDRRYALMAKFKTRNIESYNKRLSEELAEWDQSKSVYYAPDNWDGQSRLPKPKKMPYIVVVIDELADLMMVAGKEVEESIIRIAQKARACGIHLIVATQRPSADVVTGLIKANMPSRICFQVRARNDSRIILDNPGGETLLGKGDMLYLPPGIANLIRCHGPFLSDEEVRRITDHLRAQGKPTFEADIVVDKPEAADVSNDYDALYDKAVEFVCEKGYASTSAVQRQFRIGYNRAARMIEQMELDGIISEQNGSKKRKILRNALEN